MPDRVGDEVEYWLDLFDTNQARSVDAILDEWSSAGEKEFVFPIVDGPPGTGKTRVGTVAAASHLSEDRKEQVTYMAYSHYAAEKAHEDLKELGLSVEQAVRIHPNPFEKDWKRGVVGVAHDFLNLTRNEVRRLKECRFLICTTYGAGRSSRLRRRGSKIVVDEFSQVNPPMFFHILRRFRYCLPKGYSLLGDPAQLPVLTSQPALEPNIGNFMMRRKPGYRPCQLKVQHRMHRDICEAVNSLRRKALNTYAIESGEEVRDRNLIEMGYRWRASKVTDPELREILDPEHPLVIVDTDGLKGAGDEQAFGGSWRNAAEARFAGKVASSFYDSYESEAEGSLTPKILTPYTAQVSEIRRRLPPALENECITIYRSQGKEFPCVIVSFVRKNEEGRIGFLRDPTLRAQTYVACSRAQAKLVVLLSHSTFLNRGHYDFDHLCETRSARKVEVG